MKIFNKKHPSRFIKVESRKNNIITSKGFVMIIKGDHYGATILHPDIVRECYIIPDNINIKD